MIDLDKMEALAKSGYWTKEYGPTDTIDAILELIAEVRGLQDDAERWRKLESDIGDKEALIIRYDMVMRPRTTQTHSWSSFKMAAEHVIYDDVPVRETRLRWLDPDGKQTTLKAMIDAARGAK